MDCPSCGHHGAYMGLQWIHCQNVDCYHYDARYTAKMQKEAAASFSDAVEKLILLGGETLELDDD